ncbi:MAG: hypothetical protein ABH858_03295 [Candidatus Omnitrophota bacterium]
MERKATILMLVFFVLLILAPLSLPIFSSAISESNSSRRYLNSIQVFWLAEAGVNRALYELQGDYNLSGTNLFPTAMGEGGYSVDIALDGQNRVITAKGFAPFTGQSLFEHRIETVMNKYIPPHFYDNAVYTAGDIVCNGSSFEITGDVYYADELDTDNPENISGVTVCDPEISPLPRLDFQQLLTISQNQGNLYDGARLQDVKNGSDSFPNSFWFTEPSDPTDPSSGVPNVVYVQGDLQINGNIGAIAGFFVVVGDVINTPDITQEAVINGNGQIEGCIYTLGEFRVNGGGGGDLNLNGAVWAGEKVRLNGNAHIAFNENYIQGIEALNINAEVQITAWRDLNNPYLFD